MVLILRAPNTYTREDTVEIDCHGGALVLQRVLETVVKHGARTAEPGEFTKRAFLNGRIDLSQAESVMDLIQAKNDFALASSVCQLQGQVKEKITEIRQKILYEIAFIESALDDPEHYELDSYSEGLYEKVSEILQEVEKLLKNSENGTILKEGIKTVIVGKPNAGKSSLLNALVGRERAIVTDIAGTTRDVIEEQIHLGGFSLHLIDTAGIRDTKDLVEQIGVNLAKDYLEKADLVIYVADTSSPLNEDDYQIMDLLKGRKAIILLNKSDLNPVVFEEDIRKHLNQTVLPVSAKNHMGIDLLEEEIKKLFFTGKISMNDEVFITNARHKTSLLEAKKSLEFVLQSIRDGMPEDFYSIDLMNVYEELGKIVGEAVEDDLVNEIFSKFCMGK
jgi:tRNA modification GTPase